MNGKEHVQRINFNRIRNTNNFKMLNSPDEEDA